MHEAFEGTLPDGWKGGAPVTKYWSGDYIKLYRVTRPCATCSTEISIDVTKKALQGFSKNAGLLLRNCQKCREERKAGGVGSRGGKSRPIAAGAPPAAPAAVPSEELEKLRMMVSTMKDELAGLYARDKDQFAEVQALKARLAKYELQPAMAALQNKLPWE